MRIQKIYIKEYGAFSEKEFLFSEGIHLIEGSNESGKSTLLSFIRFMLYGMPRRAAGETVGERERGLSWANGLAEGNMELLSNGKSYRIERRGQLRGRGGRESYIESSKIIDMETGEEVFAGEVPGKIFLGITADVFTTTACIRQLECTDMNSDEINASIENLLFSADEEIDTQKVQAKLDDMRRVLLHKNGKGGKLFELEGEKARLESRLEAAKQAAETIIAKEAAVEKRKAFSEKTKAQIDEMEESLRLYETASTLKRFETLHAYEAQLDSLEKELGRLCREKGYQNALPDRETLGVMEHATTTLKEAEQKHKLSLAALQNAQNAPCGDRTLARFYQQTDEEGGRETLCAQFLRTLRKRKGAALRAVLCFVCALLFFAASALSVFTSLFAAYHATMPFLFYALLGGGTLFTLVGILSLLANSKAKKAISTLVGKIGLSDKNVSEASLAEHISCCQRNYELCQKYDAALLDADIALNQDKALLDKAIQSTAHMLAAVGVSCEAEASALLDALRETQTRFLAVCHERERLESKMDALRELIDGLREDLKNENEAALSTSIGKRPPSTLLAEMDIEKIRLAYQYAKTQYTLNEQKKIAVEKELIELHSTAENPARIDAKLTEVIRELEESRHKYNAIVMAYETLGVASENLRRNVTPRLRIRAGELMERLTGGKYRDLGVSTDMKITVVVDHTTRSIDALSKGTRDAAYIALRIALAELICQDNLPPLLFDESFTQLDDKRTQAMLQMLLEYTADGAQTLLFTCHKREGEMLKELGAFHAISLDA